MHFKNTITDIYNDMTDYIRNGYNNNNVMCKYSDFTRVLSMGNHDEISKMFDVIKYIYTLANALEQYCELYTQKEIWELQRLVHHNYHLDEGILFNIYCHYKNKSRFYLSIGHHACY
jgi:hypothetical protein